MFKIDCDQCGLPRLLSTRQIRLLINDDQGVVVILECWCGAMGAYRTPR